MNLPQPPAEVRGHDTVVVAASAGGVDALRTIVSRLPHDLPATVLVAMHIPSSGRTALPRILERAGPLPVDIPLDGEPLRYGRIHIAPPDQHLLVAGGTLRLSRAPRQHGHRPAADPLFVSAAVDGGPRTVAAVLSGTLDDGTAGCTAVQRCGGTVVVQDPETAAYPDMPRNASNACGSARPLALDELAAFVTDASGEPPGDGPEPPEDLIRAVELFLREVPPAQQRAAGRAGGS